MSNVVRTLIVPIASSFSGIECLPPSMIVSTPGPCFTIFSDEDDSCTLLECFLTRYELLLLPGKSFERKLVTMDSMVRDLVMNGL